jgi:ATP-dependent Clp protease ATP-binding subunit ClpC
MSRDLPANPNLEHLKKQAKALLDKLRQANPDATLVDAQHTLAREYAFPSWPKLKAHVEALPAGGDAGHRGGSGGPQPAAPSPRPMFDRFTHDARKALFFSRFEASQLGRLRIAPEHVLLGLIKGASGLTQTLLTTAGVTLDEARAATTVADAPREELNEPVEIPFQSLTKALFVAAADEADRLGHDAIATPHLMLGVLRESDYAGTFLRGKGLTLDAVRQAAAGAQPDQLQ